MFFFISLCILEGPFVGNFHVVPKSVFPPDALGETPRGESTQHVIIEGFTLPCELTFLHSKSHKCLLQITVVCSDAEVKFRVSFNKSP